MSIRNGITNFCSPLTPRSECRVAESYLSLVVALQNSVAVLCMLAYVGSQIWGRWCSAA